MKFRVIVKSSLPKKENKKNIIAILFVLKQKKKSVVIIASNCVFVPNLSYVFLLQVFKAGEKRNIRTCNLR